MRLSRVSVVALGLGLSFGMASAGCKKNDVETKDETPPPAEPPAELAKEKEIPRNYPDTTWGTLTVVAPGPLVDAVVEQMSPGYDWRAKVEKAKPGALGGFDLDAPIHALAGTVPNTPTGERFVLSFGVTTPDALETSLSLMDWQVTKADDALVATVGRMTCKVPKGSERANCWLGEEEAAAEFLAALDRRGKAEGAPRIEATLDARWLRGPVKDDIQGGAAMAKVFGPKAFESLRDAQLKEDAAQSLTELVDGGVAFLDDLDRLELTMGVLEDNAGVFGRGRVRMRSHESGLAKLFTEKYLPAGKAPAELMAMPADVNGASFVRNNPEARQSEFAKNVVGQGVKLIEGAARELDLPQDGLSTVFTSAFAESGGDWTVQVQPRIDGKQLADSNLLAGNSPQSMVWLMPRGKVSAFEGWDALTAYLDRPEVRKKMQGAFAKAQLPAPTSKVEELEGLGDRARKYTIHIELGEVGTAARLNPEMDLVVVVAETEKYTWAGFSTHEATLMDYLKRAVAGEGPTLGEDPRAKFLSTQEGWMVSYSPIDPVYIGEFLSELLNDMAGTSDEGELVFQELNAQMPGLIESWSKLPPSAATMRAFADDEGLVVEGSFPRAALRMYGDVIETGIKVFKEQKG